MSDLLGRVAGRVRLMVGRVILQAINDATLMQSMQVMVRNGEVRDDVEHFQPYGYTSVPFPGAEGISLAVGGSTDHAVVIVMDDRRYRLKGLQNGEVALYTDEGDKIILKRGNQIEVHAATSVTLVTPLTTCTGHLHVMGNQTNDGRIDATGDVTGIGKSLASHTHTEQGDGAATSPPN